MADLSHLTPAQKRALLERLLRERRGGGEHGLAPLSYSQRAMWILHALAPASAAYNTAFGARIMGEVNAGVLAQSFQDLVDRHVALRTSFTDEGGEPRQRVEEQATVAFLAVDVRGWSPEEVARRARAEVQRPFDLRQGPVFRVTLLVGEGESVLLVAVHHIVFDAWSFWILMDDLGTAYTARSSGAAPVFAPPGDYHSFIRWQQQLLGGAEGAKLWEYWRSVLAGEVPVLNLATDFPRPAIQTFNGDLVRFEVPDATVRAIAAHASRSGTTLFAALLASFSALLHRYTGQEDMIIGTPVTGRSRAEFAGIVGDFINMLALRLRPRAETGFDDYLGTVRTAVLDGLSHQDFPFPLLIERLGGERDPSRSPLFQVAFLYHTLQGGQRWRALFEEGSRDTVELGGLHLGAFPLDQQMGQFDLTLELTDPGEGLRGYCKYNTDLFTRETAQGIVRHYLTLLAAIASDPTVALGAIPLLSADARSETLLAGVAAPVAWSPEIAVHTLLDESCEEHAEAVAVRDNAQSLTYADLRRESDSAARALLNAGVVPGTIVGLCLDRSARLPVWMLGILKAGCAYLPLDPEYPRERLAYQLEDAGAAVVVTERRLVERLTGGAARPLCIEDAAAISTGASLPAVSPSSRAYVLYTSGSTGRPKGVVVPHRAFANFLLSMRESPGCSPDDTLLAVTTVCFDISGLELFLPLLAGGTVVIASSATAKDPRELARTLAASGTTIMQATPATWQMLFAAGWEGKKDLTVLCGGEALRPDLAAQLVSRCGKVWNMYGPTETTVWSSCAQVGAEGPVTIGRPIANTRLYVLDPRGEPVPRGVPGELWIGGAGVALGYHARPELTASSFRPDPFAGGDARMYRTGDLVRVLPGGDVQHLGRLDQQVKVRGFRIEPGEIETVLRAHASVADAAVLSFADSSGGHYLAAYVVARDGQIPATAMLRDHLRGTLPDYMVPSAFVQLESLPLTENRKVDRKRLPPPGRREILARAATVAPRNEVERSIATILGEILGGTPLGIDDNFFEQGGHSLLATRAAVRLQALFGGEFPVPWMFETPTVRGLAQRVATLLAAPVSAYPPMVRISREGGMALSYAQERIWFLQEMQPESTAYNIPACIRISGNVDRRTMVSALRRLIERHEALHVVIRNEGGRPVQHLIPAETVPIREISLEQLPAEQRAAEAYRLATAEARTPIDLSRGPLARFVVMDTGDSGLTISMVLHHVIADLWAFGVVGRDLAALYQAERDRREVPAPLAMHYLDFAVWQRQWLTRDVLDRQIAYWRSRLAGVPVLALPTDKQRPPIQGFAGAVVVEDFPPDLYAAVGETGRALGVTPFMIMLACYVLLLRRWSGQVDFAVGVPIANRHLPGIEEMVGTFVNTLPMRIDLSGDPTAVELLQRVRTAAVGAFAHQDLPFEQMVQELQPARDLSHAPLVQVLFNFQNAPFGRSNLSGLPWEPIAVDRGAAQFDLTLSVDPEIASMMLVEYSTDLFEEETVQRFVRQFLVLLRAVTENADRPLSALPSLPADELRHVTVLWNETAVDWGDERCVPALVAEQARVRPSAPAVRMDGRVLSFGELEARATALAGVLARRGAGKGTVVAICLDRSPAMVVTLLAILKAGAAYLPLDPDYPQERLLYMLEDSGAVLAATEEKYRALFAAAGIPVVLIDPRTAAAADDGRGVATPQGPDPGDIAYVIYTSGSTGKPKGVEIEHASFTNLLFSMRDRPGCRPGDSLLSVTTLSFDIAGLETFLPLVCGACVDLVSRAVVGDPMLLRKAVEQLRPTIMQATPVSWQMLIESGWEGDPGLRVISGGEPMSRDLARALKKRAGEVWNGYGPTETTIYSTIDRIDDPEGPITIGRPIANTLVYVLDAGGRPAPIGVPGEMVIGGAGVARGYHGRPDLTADRFVPNPFGPAGRLYRTGDLARWRNDGRLDCLGRLDNQVKVRGFRIEPGEVESVLLEQEGVKQCVVVARDDRSGTRALVAYLVSPPGIAPDLSTIREGLRRRLAPHMVPSVFVSLDALPLTPNGKVDRKALPAPEAAGGALGASTSTIPPATETERMLVALWEELLGRTGIGTRESFFDLGGHSLLATRLVSRIRETRGVELPVRTVFEASTVTDLATEIDQRQSAGRADREEFEL